MSGEALDLSGLVRTLVEPIVDYPDDLEVTQNEGEQGDYLVEILVNEEDAGKVIGR